MERILQIILVGLILVGYSSVAYAAPGDLLFEDDFNNRNYIDESGTTANVNTTAGEVSLPFVTAAGGMDAGSGVVIVQNGGYVDFYSDDGNDFLYQSRYFSPNTLVLAMRNESADHFKLNADGTGEYMAYTGSDYIPIPSLQLSGLDSVVSMTWIDEKLVALDMEERKLRQFQLNGGGWTELSSIDLNIVNPMQVISKGGDLVVLDEQGVMHVYAFTDGIHAIPAVKLANSDAVVITSDMENRVIGIATTKILEFEISGNINQTVLVNEPGANLEDAVSLNPGSVLIRDGNQVKEYVSTGADWIETGRDFIATGKGLMYLTPRDYISKLITLPYLVRGIQLVTEHSTPPGTTIDFYASIEGGPWEPINGYIIRPTTFQNVKLKAVLSSAVIATPRLQNVKLYDYSLFIDQFIVTDMVRNPGNALPTSAPVTVVGGYRFDFEVVAPGADEVGVTFSDGSEEIILVPSGQDKFAGSYYFDYNVPIGSQFDVIVRAKEFTNGSEVTRTLPAHFTIVDNIIDSANIYTTK